MLNSAEVSVIFENSLTMRLVYLLFFILLLTSCSAYQKMEGIYFSNSQDAIIIDGKKGLIETFGNATQERLSVKQNKYAIRFRWVARGRIPIIQRHVFTYKFRILSSVNDVFILSPKSKLSKKYFNNRDSIEFRSKYRLADRSVKFEKIIFHSGWCYGHCPDFSIEIDSSGNMKATNRGSAFDSIKRNDHYIGYLSPGQKEGLQRILSLSQLKTVKWAPRLCCDAPVKTIILYYNGRRIHLHAMWAPVVSWDLVNFLDSQFYNNRTFQKVDTVFTYER